MGKLIPDLMNPSGDQPNRATLMSKGGILARACDYLAELRQENHELSRRAARLEALEAENERLKGRLKALHGGSSLNFYQIFFGKPLYFFL